MKHIIFIPFLLLYALPIYCQTDNVDEFPDFSRGNETKALDKQKEVEDIYLRFIDTASYALCQKDTLSAIDFLKKYYQSSSINILKEVARYRVGLLYTQIGKDDLSIQVYNELLVSEIIRKGFWFNGNDTCRFILACRGCNGDEGGTRYNACLRLSELHIKKPQYNEAYKYLVLAESKYPAEYRGCANGYYLYKNRLDLRFSEYYLTIGDTQNAISRLFMCILDKEGYPKKAIDTLRSILYAKYSHKQIAFEINNAITNLKREKKDDKDIVILSMFGQKIEWTRWVHSEMDNIKLRLQEDRCINDLKALEYIPPQYEKVKSTDKQ